MNQQPCLCIFSMVPAIGNKGPKSLPWFLRPLLWALRILNFSPGTVGSLKGQRPGRYFTLALASSTWQRLPESQKKLLAVNGIKPIIVATPRDLNGRDQRLKADIVQYNCVLAMRPGGMRKLTAVSRSHQEHLVAKCHRSLARICHDQRGGFWFPAGAYDTSVLNLVREFKFLFALTSERGVNGPGSDPLQLKQLPIRMGFIRLILSIVRSFGVGSSAQSPSGAHANTSMTSEGAT